MKGGVRYIGMATELINGFIGFVYCLWHLLLNLQVRGLVLDTMFFICTWYSVAYHLTIQENYSELYNFFFSCLYDSGLLTMDSQKQSGYFFSGMHVKIDKTTQAIRKLLILFFLTVYICFVAETLSFPLCLSPLEFEKNDFLWSMIDIFLCFCLITRVLDL